MCVSMFGCALLIQANPNMKRSIRKKVKTERPRLLSPPQASASLLLGLELSLIDFILMRPF